jgi:hypothetical protein
VLPGLSDRKDRRCIIQRKDEIRKEIYRGFLTNCPEGVSLAREFPERIRENYEVHLWDELTAALYARERIDLSRAIQKIRKC